MTQRVGKREIILGGLLGALLIGGAAVFMNTKAGKKFKRNMRDKYDDVRERIEDFVEDISENVNPKGNFTGKAKQAVQNVMEEVQAIVDTEQEGLKAGLLIGGILGGLLGAGGTLLLTSNHQNGSGLLNNIYSQATEWRDFINDVMDKTDETAETFKNGVRKQKSKLNDVLDLAIAGAQVWQNARRRSR